NVLEAARSAGCQRMIHASFGGPKRVVVMHDAEHATPMTGAEMDEYEESLRWLWSTVNDPSRRKASTDLPRGEETDVLSPRSA
ncbi:MAG: hypothetical protein JJ992_13040, partial [Planctomycetes bacterium]|nr:hypothetical protein [Planctomycetota bacterium]